MEQNMLLLTRKPGQTLLIGDGVEVIVIRCRRGAVLLGIQAPPEISILRSEVESRRQAALPTRASVPECDHKPATDR
jgi:carbon storage regulator